MVAYERGAKGRHTEAEPDRARPRNTNPAARARGWVSRLVLETPTRAVLGLAVVLAAVVLLSSAFPSRDSAAAVFKDQRVANGFELRRPEDFHKASVEPGVSFPWESGLPAEKWGANLPDSEPAGKAGRGTLPGLPTAGARGTSRRGTGRGGVGGGGGGAATCTAEAFRASAAARRPYVTYLEAADAAWLPVVIRNARLLRLYDTPNVRHPFVVLTATGKRGLDLADRVMLSDSGVAVFDVVDICPDDAPEDCSRALNFLRLMQSEMLDSPLGWDCVVYLHHTVAVRRSLAHLFDVPHVMALRDRELVDLEHSLVPGAPILPPGFGDRVMVMQPEPNFLSRYGIVPVSWDEEVAQVCQRGVAACAGHALQPQEENGHEQRQRAQEEAQQLHTSEPGHGARAEDLVAMEVVDRALLGQYGLLPLNFCVHMTNLSRQADPFTVVLRTPDADLGALVEHDAAAVLLDAADASAGAAQADEDADGPDAGRVFGNAIREPGHARSRAIAREFLAAELETRLAERADSPSAAARELGGGKHTAAAVPKSSPSTAGLTAEQLAACQWPAEFERARRAERRHKSSREAWVAYLSSDGEPWYVESLRLMLYQLRKVCPAWEHRDFVVMVPVRDDPSVSEASRRTLLESGFLLHEVPFVPTLATAGGRMERVWPKMRVWGLTQYERVVYVDPDQVVRDICPAWLFDYPDVTMYAYDHQQCGTGLMTLRPNAALLGSMVRRAERSCIMSDQVFTCREFFNVAYFTAPYLGGFKRLLYRRGPFSTSEKKVRPLGSLAEFTTERAPFWHYSGTKPWDEDDCTNERCAQAEAEFFQRYKMFKDEMREPVLLPVPARLCHAADTCTAAQRALNRAVGISMVITSCCGATYVGQVQWLAVAAVLCAALAAALAWKRFGRAAASWLRTERGARPYTCAVQGCTDGARRLLSRKYLSGAPRRARVLQVVAGAAVLAALLVAVAVLARRGGGGSAGGARRPAKAATSAAVKITTSPGGGGRDRGPRSAWDLAVSPRVRSDVVDMSCIARGSLGPSLSQYGARNGHLPKRCEVPDLVSWKKSWRKVTLVEGDYPAVKALDRGSGELQSRAAWVAAIQSGAGAPRPRTPGRGDDELDADDAADQQQTRAEQHRQYRPVPRPTVSAPLSCAVVGEEGWLAGGLFGEAIDSHDVVVRVNSAPGAGALGRGTLGTKSAVRVLHNLEQVTALAATRELGRDELLVLLPDLQLAPARSHVADEFKRVHDFLASMGQELTSFGEPRLHVVGYDVLCAAERMLAENGCAPTTAFFATLLALSLCEEKVTVFGLDAPDYDDAWVATCNAPAGGEGASKTSPSCDASLSPSYEEALSHAPVSPWAGRGAALSLASHCATVESKRSKSAAAGGAKTKPARAYGGSTCQCPGGAHDADLERQWILSMEGVGLISVAREPAPAPARRK